MFKKILNSISFKPLEVTARCHSIITNISTKPLTNCHKTIKLQICGDLYKQFRDSGMKWYQDAPPDGIPIEVSYFDNEELIEHRTNQTVLAVHGAPGDYNHFSKLIDILT